MSAGYSGTPLAKKLGVRDGERTWRFQMPSSVADEIGRGGFCPMLLERPAPDLQMAHVFVTSKNDLSNLLKQLRPLLNPEGTIWVSWPKKAAKWNTDMSEDAVRAEALSLGLVDVKVCAIDEIWSGLKLVIRKSKRAQSRPSSGGR